MIAAISWILVTRLGLGLGLMVLALAQPERQALMAGRNWPQAAALGLMLGLLADHALGLAGTPAWQVAGEAAGVAALLGGLAFAAKRVRRARPSRSDVMAAGAAVVVTLLLILAEVTQPLTEWDARSIWFFHAKVIFFDHGLHSSQFWNNPAYDWSHKGYPELVPMLAARIARLFGVWNEFIPKAALAPLACSSFLGLLAITGRRSDFLFLCFGVPALLGATLWNGYMDGWLAFQAAIAMGALARWNSTGDRFDLYLALAALGLALCLKNEGQLLAVTALPFFVLGFRRHRLGWADTPWLAVFLPGVLWLLIKPGLSPAGDLDGPGLARGIIAMLSQGPAFLGRLGVLAKAGAHTLFYPLLAATLAIGCCMGFRKNLEGLSAMLYGLGLVAVYLGAPVDFAWLVDTSFSRVILVPEILLLTAIAGRIPEIVAASLDAEMSGPVSSSQSPSSQSLPS